MHVLIVESNRALGQLWEAHLLRQGCEVSLVATGDEAVAILRDRPVDVIVLDVVLDEGSALAVADFASYRQPATRVVFVTNTSFFSDGSIFRHAPNACAFLRSATPVEDLSAVVEHYGARSASDRAAPARSGRVR
jgi:DNA-binding NtrC family response regulator